MQEAGGQKPRVLSIDDYYMAEVTEEKMDERGIKRKMSVMKYQHDSDMDEVSERSTSANRRSSAACALGFGDVLVRSVTVLIITVALSYHIRTIGENRTNSGLSCAGSRVSFKHSGNKIQYFQ